MAGHWRHLLASDEVAPGEVVAVSAGDLDLVVWRDAAGAPAVFDARCPHQWNHLAALGVVDGSELVCTAHAWRFGADGCAYRLAGGVREPQAATNAYACREVGGAVEALLP